MQHLSPEELARLVDEPGDPRETLHLQLCGECLGELEALRAQGAQLRSLPPLSAPASAWPALEGRLRAEGLIAASPAARSGRYFPVLRIAAALALFAGGAATGAAAWPARGGSEATAPAVAALPAATPADAADALRTAEADYLAALVRYAEVTGTAEAVDPVNRLAALEGIVLTARAALREAPADPVINGYLLTALGQREAILRRMSAGVADTWF